MSRLNCLKERESSLFPLGVHGLLKRCSLQLNEEMAMMDVEVSDMSDSVRSSSLRKDLQAQVAGMVTDDEEMRKIYSEDFGGIVRRTPSLIVRPKNTEDVARVVRYAHQRCIPVSSRAIGHTLRGQALNEAGIVIDMRALNEVEAITPGAERFVCGPGALWHEVVDASTLHQLTPPVLTGYPHVTVGGTHAACGWGISSAKFGAQIDNCIEVEVVTGTGEVLRCSRSDHRELFDHVLGGMGQFGLMTKIDHRLRAYRPIVRTYRLEYDRIDTYLQDNRTLASNPIVDYLDCTVHQEPKGGSVRWTGVIRLSIEVEREDQADGTEILEGLQFDRHASTDHRNTATFLAQPESTKKDRLPGQAYPWMVTFLPWSRLQTFLEFCFEKIPPDALGGQEGPMHLWPSPRRVSKIPVLQVPEEDMMALLGIFPTATQAGLPLMMSVMSKLSDLAMRMGGRRHLATWVHFDRARWRLHYGDYWPTVNRVKKTYDPNGILNPGFVEFETEGRSVADEVNE